MGIPMEGLFGGAEFAIPTIFTVTHGVPFETSTSLTEPVPIDEGTHIGEVSEVTALPAETPSVQRGATPPAAIQIETTPVTPLVISTSDPFAALSQAVKDGSSLVVTPSSIPISATRGLDADLSSEESEDILEDLDDEPALGGGFLNSKKRNSWVCAFLPPPSFFFFFFFVLSSLFPFCLYVLFSCLQSPLRGQDLQQM